ncbi:Essential protein Yae1, N terminal [Friedmanniomyces endolithicus]|nr:Essential protein Yae1, N terminal [Friedmanniomyces endolithicus]
MLRDLPPFTNEDGHNVLMIGSQGHEETNDTYLDPLDDVFGSAPASPSLSGEDGGENGHRTVPPSGLGHSDISRLRNTHVNNGYREGITASKERHMQDGFDEGYSLGAELGLTAGWCLGAFEGLWRASPEASEQEDRSNRGVGGKDNGISRTELLVLLRAAQLELDISRLCGKDYFGEDGLWLYGVPEHLAGEHGMTFERIAAAHPIPRKWTDKVMEVSEQLGLQLGTIAIPDGEISNDMSSQSSFTDDPSQDTGTPPDAEQDPASANEADAEGSDGSGTIVVSYTRSTTHGGDADVDSDSSDSEEPDSDVASTQGRPMRLRSAGLPPVDALSNATRRLRSAGPLPSIGPSSATMRLRSADPPPLYGSSDAAMSFRSGGPLLSIGALNELRRRRRSAGPPPQDPSSDAPRRMRSAGVPPPHASSSAARSMRSAGLPPPNASSDAGDSPLSDEDQAPVLKPNTRAAESIARQASSARSRRAGRAPVARRVGSRVVIPDSESDGELSERSATPPAPELPRVPGRTVRKSRVSNREPESELFDRSATPSAPDPPHIPRQSARKRKISHSKSDSELSDRSATPSTPGLPKLNERQSGRATVSDDNSDTELSDRSATPPRPSVACKCNTACTCATHAYFSEGFAASAMHLGSAALDEMADRQPVSALRETLGRELEGD